MATVVLTAVGTVLGGPIGAAIGALAGQGVDARLFAPKARHGPRLGELAVQTSSYGTPIPKIFGTLRVAGTVIWSTDLQEHRTASGGGKGRPKSVNYSYSASFAVALSGRSIRGVRRIWADGKLLRGAAGDFKSETKYRLHPGDEDQAPDPLIAAAEGAGGTSAYRGIAYAVFEDFQLADYANRIPSLTFEVEADGAAVPIGAIAEELSGGLVLGGDTPALAGYAAGGDSVRGALEDLASVFPLRLIEQGGGFRLDREAGAVIALGRDAAGAHRGQSGRGRTETERRRDAPAEVEISYYEPARDYQTGLQRAVRAGRNGARAERLSLAAALTADRAKALAQERLARLDIERTSATVHLGWRHGSIRPGALVTLEGQSGRWRVSRWTLEEMVVRLELRRAAGSGGDVRPATPGRSTTQPDLLHGPTSLRVLDLPLFPERPAERPQLVVAAAGVEPGWRGAALSVSYDAGASWQPAGGTAAAAVIGTAGGPLPPAAGTLLDNAHAVEIELLNGAMALESRSDEALVGGANLALLGSELIQFGRAEQIGVKRYRLSRLLRGRFGTEWASDIHAAGEGFLLIELHGLMGIEPSTALIGAEVRLLATGIGDGPDGSLASCRLSGETLRPPAPVHLRAVREADGTLVIRWTRRSRSGWRWLDGVDAPLGEEAERYLISLSSDAGLARVAETTAPVFVYDAGMQAADGVAGPVSISLAQLGTFGSSRRAQLITS